MRTVMTKVTFRR